MTAWVISIANDYADHWDIAAEHGGWDLRRNARIQPGDDVFFRISQGNLAGWTRATSPTTPTDDAPIIPWRNSLTGGYTHRFTFDVVSTTVTAASTWADIKAATGTSEVPNKPVRFDDLVQQEALQGMFVVGPRVDVAAPLVDVEVAYDHRDTDERQRALRAVVNRYGQPQFREKVLSAYGRTCAITGSGVHHVLEAAHIDPYLGGHTQHVTNGLLLRSDVHTLFDLHLITVTEDFRVAVAPELRNTEYAAYDGQPLGVPGQQAHRPDGKALRRHRAACPWVSTTADGRRY